MKVSIKSLNLYLKNKLSTAEIVKLLGRTEVEVEEIMYSNSWDKKIVTAKVVSVAPHPDADKLRIAYIVIDEHSQETIEIVCGAPNLAANQIVVLAQTGSVLPDGLEIKASKLRGILSNGMLCSSHELGISDDHSGILVLDPTTPVGQSLCDIWENDDVLDIKTPANRWDYLSLIGLCREVAAFDTDNSVELPRMAKIEYSNTERVNVKEIGECKRFVSVKYSIDNSVKSPQWLVDNLEGNGLRSISPVVDITNFVMIETGQPSHAYDASKLQGGISVRFASPAEKLTTLDGVERTLSQEDLVIADDRGVIGLAGVMGGASTEVDQHTKEVLIEIANFDKTRIRRTALRHGLRSEASARFERSLPLPLPLFAMERMVYLLENELGVKIIDSPADQLYGWPWVQQIGLRIRKAEKLLGISLDEKKVMGGLQKLGFEVEHFSITKETKKHLGKPYIWGASFRKNGEDGFDCSYLVDRIYSRIGVRVGYVALGQFHHGRPVEVGDLKPGDVVFYEGLIKESPTDHYYVSDGSTGHRKIELDKPMKVGHNGIYIGNNKVITAIQYERKGQEWMPREKQGVIEVPLSDFTNDPGYLGARRYVESFNHTLAITVPWWREDVRNEQDIIEEIAKIVGYENIPSTLPQLPATNTRPHQLLPRLLELKKTLVATGLTEVVTYSFIGEEDITWVRGDVGEHLEIVKPLTREQQYLRTSMLSSHLRTIKNNQDYSKSYAFFEISRIHKPQPERELPNEAWQIAITVVGENCAERLKYYLDVVLDKLQQQAKITMKDNQEYMVGRSAEVKLNKKRIGTFGQLASVVLRDFDIISEVSFGEFLLSDLLNTDESIKVVDGPQYQLVVRDIALGCDISTTWQDIQRIVTTTKQVVKSEFLSEYSDDQLTSQKRKRVALRVWLDLGPNPSATSIQSVMTLAEDRLRKAPELSGVEIV